MLMPMLVSPSMLILPAGLARVMPLSVAWRAVEVDSVAAACTVTSRMEPSPSAMGVLPLEVAMNRCLPSTTLVAMS